MIKKSSPGSGVLKIFKMLVIKKCLPASGGLPKKKIQYE